MRLELPPRGLTRYAAPLKMSGACFPPRKDHPVIPYHAIAQLEEARQAVGTAEIAREAEEIAGGWMAYTGPGSWSNQACGFALQGPITDAELDRLVEFYTTRGVEPQIEVCPFADASLLKGLVARGFQPREFESVLARELTEGEDLRAAHPHGWPAELELVRVDPADEDLLRCFVEMSTLGFRPPDEPVDELMFELSANMVRHPRCESYLARWEGVDVGGGMVEFAPPIACLIGTSVAEPFRRRGIQAALMLKRLEHARERDCSLAIIHSRPGISTERNAQRLGFFGAYTKIVMAKPGAGLVPSP